MAEPIITCPNCSSEIPLTESLAAPLIRATKKRYEDLLAQKDRNIASREETVREKEAQLQQDRAQLEENVSQRLGAEQTRIAAEESAKARRLIAAELNQKAQEVSELQTVLKQREDKLAEAAKAQVELARKERELEDTKRELDLTVERKVQSGLAEVREKAKQDVTAEIGLQVREKDEQIASMQRQIEDLRRKAQQGSQQLQGEVQELELEEMLRAKFPRDIVEAVPKGEFGGDVLHQVLAPNNQHCGTILWESKRTKNWSEGWLTKIREDQRRAKADVALIVTTALPKGSNTFDHVDGVWVTETRCAIPVAIALRHSLIEIAAARQAGEGQQTKMELVYRYLTGPRFRQRVEAIVERFSEMQDDLDKERRAMTRLWAKREAQIRSVVEATAGMYGDLQGIAGKALEEIEGIALPLIELSSDLTQEQAPTGRMTQ